MAHRNARLGPAGRRELVQLMLMGDVGKAGGSPSLRLALHCE
jgi:hypothetical protein